MSEIANYTPTEKESQLLSKWSKRFQSSKRFRQPYEDKMLRMWKLYRAYRDKINYAYQTNLMPPTGFEIVETIKPRLSSAKTRTRIFPMSKDDAGSQGIEEWDSLINYNFEHSMELEENKVDWIDSMLKYGNGYAHIFWDDQVEEPGMEIIDNWLLYIDPQSGNRLKDSQWEIKRVYKSKKQIEKDEEKRGDYEEEVEDEYGKTKTVTKKGIYDNLECVENEQISDDPRTERVELETLKMGQITNGAIKDSQDTQKGTSDEKNQLPMVEIWECYDHIDDTITTIFNRKVIGRHETNPYKNINEGRMIVDLPCIRVPWSAYAMGIMEPVETVIHEIADSRNQAMDSIVLNLDPIKKVKKGKQIDADSLKTGPGAIWELDQVDDVVIERGDAPNNVWVEKDNLLRREIQTSLALSEYVRGLPSSSQEPSSKVEMLLQQTNIRFSQMVRQLETALADVANIAIQMNQKFLKEESKSYRIIGDEVDFKEFTAKDVAVDARVELEVKEEKGPEQRKTEILKIYDLFIAGDQPNPEDPEAMKTYQAKKRELQKLVLEEFDLSQYEDVILGLESKENAEQDRDQMNKETEVEVMEEPEQVATREPPQPIPLLESESAQELPPQQNVLQRLIQRIRGN